MVDYVVVSTLLLFSLSNCLAVYEDARCKCVCVDRQGSYNGTRPTGKIYVKAIAADQCTCKLMLEKEADLCPYCDCKYQVRNTTTIKVVVCLILAVISALTLYMIFLLLLEPLLSARRSGYKSTTTGSSPEPVSSFGRWSSADISRKTSWTGVHSFQQMSSKRPGNLDPSRLRQRAAKPGPLMESDDLSPTGRSRLTSTSAISPTAGVSTVVRNVRDQQQRWKGNVEAQRARVFSEHTLLN